MPSWTGSFMAPTASTSKENRLEENGTKNKRKSITKKQCIFRCPDSSFSALKETSTQGGQYRALRYGQLQRFLQSYNQSCQRSVITVMGQTARRENCGWTRQPC